MRIRTTYQGVKQSRTVKTFCIKCDKKLTRVISDCYYRNGLHNEEETRRKNDKNLDVKKKKMEREGVICRKCEQT